MLALERAKRVQAALTKLVERRERLQQKATAEFRLDLLAAVDAVDDETLALVLRGLAMDRAEQGLQYALQIAIDDRNEARRRASGEPVDTRRSADDPHEAVTEVPPPLLPPSLSAIEGDEDDLSHLDTPLPPPPATPRLNLEQQVHDAVERGEVDDDGFRYPEPGEAAVELPDGRIVAAAP